MIAAQGYGYKLSRGRDSKVGDGGSPGDLGEEKGSLWAAADFGRHKDNERTGCSCYHPLQKVLVQTDHLYDDHWQTEFICLWPW